jgi:RNA polymerase sigma factor (sigma-70 family)
MRFDSSFITTMRPVLLRYFRRGICTAEAEDLTQDVLLRCLGRRLEGTPDQIRAYLFRAARNRWRDRRRRIATHGTVLGWDDEETEDLPRVETTPESVLALEQEVDALVRRFDRLGSRARRVILWTKVDEMRIDTVARRLGVSRSTVNKCLARGIAHLRGSRCLTV